MPDAAPLSARFRLSIPKAVRAMLHWKVGQKFALLPRGTGVMPVAVPEPADLAGTAEGAKAEAYRDRTNRF
jgi:bifunctional DNA-binding transcriptional regulator/antitoxin component of YhaV-PrlF toxin-antitoxin module